MTRWYQIIFMAFFALLLTGCGEEAEQPKGAATSPTSTETAAPESQTEAVSATESEPIQEPASVEEPVPMSVPKTVLEPHDVVYQEEIYAKWPVQEIVEYPSEAEPTDAEPEVPKPAAKTHTINAQARIFKPDIVYINPGDTVRWVNMTSHNTVSVEGMIPDGAKAWQSKLGENLKLKLDVEGVYAYVCQPHIGFGMLGLIIVGQPNNLESMQKYASESLKGPFRRLIGKLKKVSVPQ